MTATLHRNVKLQHNTISTSRQRSRQKSALDYIAFQFSAKWNRAALSSWTFGGPRVARSHTDTAVAMAAVAEAGTIVVATVPPLAHILAAAVGTACCLASGGHILYI